MKRFFVFLCGIMMFSFVSIAQTPQTTKLQEIKEKVAEINKKLPITTDRGSNIESMKVDDGYIVQCASRPSMYDSDGNSLSRSFGESFLEQAKNENVRGMYEDYIAAELGVKQVMSFRDSLKTETLTFEVADLKRMLSFPASAYRELLSELRSGRESLPLVAVEGITCIAIETPHNELLYIYVVDENMYQIESLQKTLNEYKSSVLSSMAEIAKLCANAGFGIGMKYIGKSSGKSAEKIVSYDELKVYIE